MNLHCPHCGVTGSADDSYSGRKVKCPKCDGMFEISPEPSVDLSGNASPEPSTTSISLLCPECGVKGSADASFTGKSVRCPKCTAIFIATPGPAVDDAATVTHVDEVVIDPVAAAVVEEVVEPLTDGEAKPPLVDSVAVESTDPVVMAGEDAVLAAVEDDWERETVPVGLGETGDLKEPELAAVVEEVEIATGGDDEPLEAATPIEEEIPVPTEDVEQKVPEHEEAVLLNEEKVAAPKILRPVLKSVRPPKIVKPAAVPIEQTPYGVDADECWQCGKTDSSGQPFTTKDGRMYCADCVPVEEAAKTEVPVEEVATASGFVGLEPEEPSVAATSQPDAPYYDFSIGEALSEAWAHTRGAKWTIWKGSILMYLTIFVVVAVGAFFLPSEGSDTQDVFGMVGGAIFQAIGDAISVIFTAGLLFMGIRRVAGDPIEWRMVFNGFSCAGKIIIATILQSILISVGILLLILPGIYLAVGYAMALPLIVDQGMSPWEAMETSRKAIHKIWWKTAGLLLIMGLIMMVSMIPLGIGLIWTWPMFIVLAGVVYRYLFGVHKSGE
ncbi:MAG: hypothetical protein ACN4GW_07755 [Desulforhopalus sp.]